MQITIQDIEHLAKLARIEVTEEEKNTIQKDLNAIVGYISDIQEITEADTVQATHDHNNILRPDVATNQPNQFTERILQNSPERKDNYVKVNQVL